mgnify:CR=1 FL=1
MKTFKTIIALLTIFLFVFSANLVCADTEGDVSTDTYFNWGDSLSGNYGNAGINAFGGYNLTGQTTEGNTWVEGLTYGEVNLGTVNEDGFTSNSSFGFGEMSGSAEALSGNGTLELGATGNLGNWSQIGDGENNFSTAFHETSIDALNQETENSSLIGNLRVSGHSSTSEKEADTYKIQVGQFYTEFTGNLSGSATVDGGVETQAQKTADGINSQSSTNTTTNGFTIENNEYVESFGDSTAIAVTGPEGSYNKATAHSYIKSGEVTTDQQ